MATLKEQIYGNWHVEAEYNNVGIKEVKLTKIKKTSNRWTQTVEDEKHIHIPRDFLIKLGKWLEAHKIIEGE